MSTRYRVAPLPAARPASRARAADTVPSRTIIVVMIAIFFAISITALLAGFLPAKPAVLPTTEVTYQEVFAQDRQVLDNYAWLNRQEGRVYIPVNRAMELIAERGLPTRPQSDEQQQP